ncbi:MAG TPA: transposase [Sideroxyarcus sp.]|nr:transposase [Sideroxyarcus sp.]
MDTSVERAQSSAIPKKQRRSIAEKRRIVEETLAAGVSVARVGRAHGVNANQVFQWRRLYRAGRLGGTPATVKLLPVSVEAPTAPTTQQAAVEPASGAIHVKLGHAQIRIEGSADPALVRMVLESLRG